MPWFWCLSTACNLGGQGSVSDQFICDLRWTKWQWDFVFILKPRIWSVTIIKPTMPTHYLFVYHRRCIILKQTVQLKRTAFWICTFHQIVVRRPHRGLWMWLKRNVWEIEAFVTAFMKAWLRVRPACQRPACTRVCPPLTWADKHMYVNATVLIGSK